MSDEVALQATFQRVVTLTHRHEAMTFKDVDPEISEITESFQFLLQFRKGERSSEVGNADGPRNRGAL